MKKWISLLCIFAVLLSFSACSAAVDDTSQSPAASTPAAETDADATLLTFSDSGIAVDENGYSGYEIDGTALTITQSGIYRLSGSCQDGSVTVKKGVTDVTLVLDGLSLTSCSTAAITCAKSSGVTILAAAGTENSLADAPENNSDEYPENEAAENAVIKCKDGSQVTLCGSGSLSITASGKNGIKSGASTTEEGEAALYIQDLALTISAPVNDAVNAEAYLSIASGTLTISAGDDAIHCDYTLEIGGSGTTGPSITVESCYEGLEAATLSIASGTIRIHSEDDCLNTANSDLSGYAFSLTISGGTLNMYSENGDGIDSNGTLTISGGSIFVCTANTADNAPLDADGTLSLTGGTVLAAGGSAGMGLSLSAGQAYVTFGGSAMGSGGGQPGNGKDFNDQPPADMPDFGSDTAPTDMPDIPDFSSGKAPIDFDGQLPPSGEGGFPGTQGGGAGVLISAGSSFEVLDSSGSVLYSGTAPCDLTYLFFSSAQLASGESYTLVSGGETINQADAGTEGSLSGISFPGEMSGEMQPGGNAGTAPEKPQTGSAQ